MLASRNSNGPNLNSNRTISFSLNTFNISDYLYKKQSLLSLFHVAAESRSWLWRWKSKLIENETYSIIHLLNYRVIDSKAENLLDYNQSKDFITQFEYFLQG